jgi:hypothetical protein
MSPNAPAGPNDFREQLSAWHDGALPEEASRFVLKRLLRDESLRAEVGRWQVIGDALRRQAQQRPAGDLPDRLAATVAAEDGRMVAHAPVNPSAVPRRAGSLRWLATAAALGLVAVLVWPSDPVPVARDAEPLIAEAPVPSAAAARPALPSRPLPMPPRRAEASPSASLVAAVPPLVRAPQPTPEQLAPLPAVDAPSRPWPRNASEQGVYTVDYGVPAAAPPRQ